FGADEHEANRIAEHRIVRGKNRAAGIPEHVGHPFAHERFPENLCTGQLHKNPVLRIADCGLRIAEIADYKAGPRLTATRIPRSSAIRNPQSTVIPQSALRTPQ